MQRNLSFRPALFLVGLGLCLGAAGMLFPGRIPQKASAQTTVGPMHRLFEAADEAVHESSGLAASSRYAGYVWTHNDSGDQARVFLLAPNGKTAATVRFPGVPHLDWEDMALGVHKGESWVYVADIGDNLRKRIDGTIYRFREPQIELNPEGAIELSLVPESMTITYPDEAHDVEAMAVEADGRLIFVSKSALGSTIFRSPDIFLHRGAQRLDAVGEFSFGSSGNSRLVTGADLSPDGKHFAVMTYTNLYEWDVPGDSEWTRIWGVTPRVTRLPQLRQAEAVTYNRAGDHLWVSSEGYPMPLWSIPRPF